MNIVHISDLHYSISNSSQKVVSERFFEDLKVVIDLYGPIDMVIMSGDIVNNPDDPDVYGLALDNFVAPMLAAAKVSVEKLVLVPGNHDISFTSIKKRKLQFESLRSNRGDQSFICDPSVLAELSEYARSISENFFVFSEAVGNLWKSPFYRIDKHNGINVVSINTSFGCSVDGSHADQGQLDFPLSLVEQLTLDHGDPIILVGHHPFSYFSEGTQRVLEPQFAPKLGAYLFGHVHQPRPVYQRTPSGNLVHLQSGALSAKGDAFQGYTILQLSDAAHHRVAHYRTFFRDRQTFDTGLNVSDGGLFEVDLGANLHWRRLQSAPKVEDYLAWINQSGAALLPELDETLEGRSLWDSFVFPRIIKVNISDVENQSSELFSLPRLLESEDHIVLAADPGSGSTSVLRYIAQFVIRNAAQLSRNLTPAIINAQTLKSYESSVQRAVKVGMPDLAAPISTLSDVESHSRLLILVDGCDPHSESQKEALTMLRTMHPKARFIVVISPPTLVEGLLRPSMFLPEYTYTQLETFSRRGVHQLVVKWRLPSGYSTRRVVDDTLIKFRSLGIPLNGPYLSMYLSVLEKISNYNPLNSSTVIENFVEALLEKGSITGIFRKDFDYRNQVQLLSYIAEKMTRSSAYIVDYEVIYEWLREYFKRYGLSQDSEVAIRYFISARILTYSANKICFRHNLFLSFFIAYRMERDREFKDWITENPRYLSFVAEIEIYGGLSRDDNELLDLLKTYYSEYAVRIASRSAKWGWSDNLEHFTLPETDDQDEFVSRVAEQLTGEPPSEEAAMGELESRDVTSSANQFERPEVRKLTSQWLRSLKAYSLLFKNLEHVVDAVKREHLRIIVTGWSSVITNFCIIMKEVLSDQFWVQIGGASVNIPDDKRAKFLRTILVALPDFVSEDMWANLGSSKLELQLRDNNCVSELGALFLQKGLAVDLRIPEYHAEIAFLRKQLKGSRFFLEALLFKLRTTYIRFGRDATDDLPLQRLVAEIRADLANPRGGQRQKYVDDVMKDLRHRRLIDEMRQKTD